MTLALSGKSRQRQMALVVFGMVAVMAAVAAGALSEMNRAAAGTRTIRVQVLTTASMNPASTFTVTVGPLTFYPTIAKNNKTGNMTAKQNLSTDSAAVEETVLPDGWSKVAGGTFALRVDGYSSCSGTESYSDTLVIPANGNNYLICIKNSFSPPLPSLEKREFAALPVDASQAYWEVVISNDKSGAIARTVYVTDDHAVLLRTTASSTACGTIPAGGLAGPWTCAVPAGGFLILKVAKPLVPYATNAADLCEPGVIANSVAARLDSATGNAITNSPVTDVQIEVPASTAQNCLKPDLTVGMFNDSSAGVVIRPGSFHWTLQVDNAGPGTADFQPGWTVLKDDLPVSGSYSIDGVTGQTSNLNCAVSAGSLTCSAVGGVFSLPPWSSVSVSLEVSLAAEFAGILANPKVGGMCDVDPDVHVAETDTDNNSCSDSVMVQSPPGTINIQKVGDFSPTTSFTGAISGGPESVNEIWEAALGDSDAVSVAEGSGYSVSEAITLPADVEGGWITSVAYKWGGPGDTVDCTNVDGYGATAPDNISVTGGETTNVCVRNGFTPMPTLSKAGNADASTSTDAVWDITVDNTFLGAARQSVTITDGEAALVDDAPSGCIGALATGLTCSVGTVEPLKLRVRRTVGATCGPQDVTNSATARIGDRDITRSPASNVSVIVPGAVDQCGKPILSKKAVPDRATPAYAEWEITVDNAVDQSTGRRVTITDPGVSIVGPVPIGCDSGDIGTGLACTLARGEKLTFSVGRTFAATCRGTSAGNSATATIDAENIAGSPTSAAIVDVPGDPAVCVFPTISKSPNITLTSPTTAAWDITIDNRDLNSQNRAVVIVDKNVALASVPQGCSDADKLGTTGMTCDVAAEESLTITVTRVVGATCQGSTETNSASASSDGVELAGDASNVEVAAPGEPSLCDRSVTIGKVVDNAVDDVTAFGVSMDGTALGSISASGTTASVTIKPGDEPAITEDDVAGYAHVGWKVYQGTLDCASTARTLLAAGDGATASLPGTSSDVTVCFVNHRLDQARLQLKVEVDNAYGGSSTAGDFAPSLTPLGGASLGGQAVAWSTDGSPHVLVLDPGQYQLGESSLPGYTNGAWDCGAGHPLTGNVLTLDWEDEVTCTVTNASEKAHIEVNTTYVLHGDTKIAPTILLNGSPLADPSSGDATHDAWGAVDVNAGVSTVDESLPEGWRQESIRASEGCGQTKTTGTGITVRPGPGATCQVTFTNERETGSLVVHKQKTDSQPDDGTTFSGTVNGMLPWGPIGIGDSATLGDVPAGPATIEESTPSKGWHRLGLLAAYDRSEGCPADAAAYGGETVLVAAGVKTEVCILNDQSAEQVLRTLMVGKVVVGPTSVGSISFSGTISPGGTSWSAADGQVATFAGLQANVYSVSEATSPGYATLGYRVLYDGRTSCPADDGAYESTTSAVADLTPKEQTIALVCVYNQPVGTISVTKTTTLNGSANAAERSEWHITVSSVKCSVSRSGDTDSTGRARFANLPACDDYVVAEDVASWPGYAAVGPSSFRGVAVIAGANVSLSFTNNREMATPPVPACVANCGPMTSPVTPDPPATPSATPRPSATATAEPPRGTPSPGNADVVLGERTSAPAPLATPAAPVTGQGTATEPAAGRARLLAVLGLLAMSAGFSIFSMRRRRQR